MRVCDHCRDFSRPVLDIQLALLQPDPDNGRLKPKELKARTIELCETCVKTVWDCLNTSLDAVTRK